MCCMCNGGNCNHTGPHNYCSMHGGNYVPINYPYTPAPSYPLPYEPNHFQFVTIDWNAKWLELEQKIQLMQIEIDKLKLERKRGKKTKAAVI